MKHWESLIFNDEVHVVGRGLILTVNLKKNNIHGKKSPPISVGDTLVYDFKEYKITGIESFRNLFDGAESHLVGLIVRKL